MAMNYLKTLIGCIDTLDICPKNSRYECMNFVQPAFKIASDLKDAWESIPEKHRN